MAFALDKRIFWKFWHMDFCSSLRIIHSPPCTGIPKLVKMIRCSIHNYEFITNCMNMTCQFFSSVSICFRVLADIVLDLDRLFYKRWCIPRHFHMRLCCQLKLNMNAKWEAPKEWRKLSFETLLFLKDWNTLKSQWFLLSKLNFFFQQIQPCGWWWA